MATKIEALEKTIRAQEKMKANFEKKGKDKFSKKIEEKVKDLKAELKKLKDADKPKKEAKKPAKSKSKKIAGTMSEEDCRKLLKKMRGKYMKSESTTKKNIEEGRATKDGVLKPSASLENESESIENKADSGQTINKKEQKAIAFNIETIVKNCVEMIKYKKDADQLLKDLIRSLGELRADIASGRLKPGAQN
tara:strand:- start:3990 stop:4568 length:579 start_codon:yes stop_codon:yes gene_type:complete